MSKYGSSISTSLYELYTKYYKKKLLPPEWQRQLVWTKDKIENWHKTIEKGGAIPGVFIMFTIKGDNTVYINDGMQRTMATELYAEKLKDKETVQERLAEVYITQQNLEYDNMDEAFQDFFSINLGTTCTPYELGQGILCNKLNHFKEFWEPFLKNLHESVSNTLARIGINQRQKKGGGREANHKHKRDDFALFLRYCLKDKNKSNYNSGKQRFSPEDISDPVKMSKIIEYKLQKLLSEIGIEQAEKNLKNFHQFLANQMAIYENNWSKSANSETVPTPTHIRYYLATAIYRHNNELSIPKFVEFTEKFINKTSGGATIERHLSTRVNKFMSLSNLSTLPHLCDILGVEEFIEPQKRRKRTKLKPGYNHSHIKPFVTYGEGETIVEPGLINCSRGKSEISPHDFCTSF